MLRVVATYRGRLVEALSNIRLISIVQINLYAALVQSHHSSHIQATHIHRYIPLDAANPLANDSEIAHLHANTE